MTTLEDLYGKAKSVAENVGQKTGELMELTKLKLAVAEAEKELSVSFERLGRLVYHAHQTNTDASQAQAACEEQIAKQKQQLAALRDTIAEVKNGVRCQYCNTINDPDAAYCKKCGGAL